MRLQARATNDFLRLNAVVKPFITSISKVRNAIWGYSPTIAPQVFSDIVRDARNLLPLLVFNIEYEISNPGFKKFTLRHKKIQKLVKNIASAKTPEDLLSILQNASSKSKDVYDKFKSHLKEYELSIRFLDSEIETISHINGFRVFFQTEPDFDWVDSKSSSFDTDPAKVEAVLSQVTRRLKMVGLGAFANGTVFAYPSETLPSSARTSRNSLAAYRPATDTLLVAFSHDVPEIINNVLHEIGHRVYFKFLGSVGRVTWRSYFEGREKSDVVDQIGVLWESFVKKTNDEKCSSFFSSEIKSLNPNHPLYMAFYKFRGVICKDDADENRAMYRKKRKETKSDYARFLENKGNFKFFEDAVTGYSASSPEEAFAEAFGYALFKGPRFLPERLLIALKSALPDLKI